MKQEIKPLIARTVLFFAILQIILAAISYLYTSIYNLSTQIRFLDLRYNDFIISLFIISLAVLSLFMIITAIFSYVKLLINFIFSQDYKAQDESTEKINKEDSMEKRIFIKRIMNIVLLIIMSFVSTLIIPILGSIIGY